MLMDMYSDAIPPLPALMMNGTGEICRTSMSGMGDPFGITDIAGAVSSYFQAKNAADLQKKQLALEAQAQKAQRLQDAQNFALQQAQSQVEPDKQKRNQQVYALYAVGGVAALVSLAVLLSAMKGKRK